MGIVSALREQMHATLSRSDILRPLTGLISILLTASLISLYFGFAAWFCYGLGTFLFLSLLLYLFTYGLSAIFRPDVLRSEKYALQKMALEHNIVGDSSTGIIEVTSDPRSLTAPAAVKNQAEGEL